MPPPLTPRRASVQDVDVSAEGPHDDILAVHFLGWTDAWNEEVLRGEAAAHLAPFMSLSEPWEFALRPGDLVELNRAHPAVVAALSAAATSSAGSGALTPAAVPSSAAHHSSAAASRGLWVVGCIVSMDHSSLPPLMTVAFAVPAAAAEAAAGGQQQVGAVPALATLPVISAEKDACVRLGTHITRDKAIYMFKQEIFERAGISLPPAPHGPSFAETEAGISSARSAALPLPPPKAAA